VAVSRGIVSVLTSPASLGIKLVEIIRKYQKKKRTESRFVSAFENEIRTYLDVYHRISDLGEKEILPVFDSIGKEFTPHQMNELLERMLPLPLMHAEMIKAFVGFAKACSEVSAIKGFMEYLKDSNIILYDFVDGMKNIYVAEENKVVINGRYYRFFKTYERDIYGKVRENNAELNAIIKQMKKHVNKIQSYANKTAFIKRKLRKKYLKNYRVLAKASSAMTIKRTTIINLRAYLPRSLFPIAIFIEELSLKPPR